MNIPKLVNILYNFTRKLAMSCLIVIKIFMGMVMSWVRTQIKPSSQHSVTTGM